MRKILFRFWPIIYVFSLWLLFSSPYLLKGLVPYPSKYQVTFFPPWSSYQQWWGPVKNNAMSDVIDQIYPWKHFTIEWMRHGQIPFWNPYNFAGNPHMANFQSAVFSPFNLLYFVLPFIDAWSLLVLFQPLLAGISMYIFLRELQVSRAGSLLSAITFMFCGFIVVWMAYGTLAMAIALLPLALWGIERGFSSHKKRFFLISTICFVTSFFSGHIQTSFYFALYTFIYLLLKTVIVYISKHRITMTVIHGFLFFTLGVVISFLQVYPTFSFYQVSVRSSSANIGGGIPWTYLPTIFAPDFYGNPVTRNDWLGSYAEWASFIGIIPLFLAFFALVRRKDTYVRFFFFFGCAAVFLAMETPFHSLLVASRIPILATSIPSRMIVLFSFSFAVLAGYGLDELYLQLRKRSYKNISLLISGFVFLLALLWLILFASHVFPVDKLSIAKKNLFLPTAFLAMLGGVLVINNFIPRKMLVATSCILLVFFASLDSYRFAAKWMPFDPRHLVFPEVPVIKAMQQRIGYGRYFGNLGTEVATYYGLSSLDGYDPLYIQRYGEFIRYGTDGTFYSAERSVARVARVGKHTDKILDLLGVSLIFHPIADTGQNWAYPVWRNSSRYSLVYKDDKFQLFKNNAALPRVKLFTRYEIIQNGQSLLKRFYSDEFDFRNVILLEERPKLGIQEFTSRIAEEKSSVPAKYDRNNEEIAEITSYTPNKIIVSVSTPKPALLFLSDTYYPTWQAKVNGKITKIYRADYAFRAVEVPGGESIIEFEYKYL